MANRLNLRGPLEFSVEDLWSNDLSDEVAQRFDAFQRELQDPSSDVEKQVPPKKQE